MKKGIFFLSLLIILGCKSNQLVQIPEDFSCELIDFPVQDFKIDVFGSFYFIKPDNSLTVYDNEFNEQFNYFNNGLGHISFIDISNPRKILLFFKDFQKVVFLDNTLSEIGRFEWNIEEAMDIKAIGSSRDNFIWLYDGLDYRLKKVDSKGNTLLSSNPLQTHFEIDISPDYIIEKNNFVYLIEEGIKVLVFDNFGNYVKTIAISAYSFEFDQGYYYYVDHQGFYAKESLQNVFAERINLANLPEKVRIAQGIDKKLYYLVDFCLKVQPI
jgi:hypothetical protein